MMSSEKIPLGFVETSTENERVCRQLIQDLIRRGLHYHEGLLAIIDGSKGLHSAIRKTLKGYVRIHRCQWHKRENVVSYLPEPERPRFRRKLQKAYDTRFLPESKNCSGGTLARTGSVKPIGTWQPRRRAGRNAHPPSAWNAPVPEAKLSDHQLHRGDQ